MQHSPSFTEMLLVAFWIGFQIGFPLRIYLLPRLVASFLFLCLCRLRVVCIHMNPR